MTPADTLAALREMRAAAASLVAYYSEADKKRTQNEALQAAGLEPMHSERSLKWDDDQRAKHERHIAVLDALIADLTATEAEAA